MYLNIYNVKILKNTNKDQYHKWFQWSLWSGYGGAIASEGFPVLAEVIVFQAEFPGLLHGSSLPVALFVFTQWLGKGGVGWPYFQPPG